MTPRAEELERLEAARAEPFAPGEEEVRAPGRGARRSAAFEREDAVEPLTFARWAAETLERWRLVRRGALLGLVVAVLALVVMSPVYQSEATFATQGASSLKLPGGASLGSIAQLASQFGMNAPGSDASDSPDFYAKLVSGRELLTRLALSRVPDPRTASPSDSARVLDLLSDSVSLGERLGVRRPDPARRLEKVVKLLRLKVLDVAFDQRTGIVVITVETKWPEVSRAIANRVVALVGSYNIEQRQTRAKSRRVFTQSRLSDAQRDLTRSETQLRDFYEGNRQWRTSPILTFEEGRLRRQVDVATEMYLTLRREFETARIAEVNDAPVVSLLDSAVAARRPVRPEPLAMLVATTLVGALLGLLLAAIAAAAADWSRRDPATAAALRSALRRAVTETLPWRRRRAPAPAPADRA